MGTHASTRAPHSRCRRTVIQLLAAAPVLLSGCGGGGSPAADLPSAAGPGASPPPAPPTPLGQGDTLLAGGVQVVDAVVHWNSLRPLAVGRLPGGGHAVIWVTADAVWQSPALWMRRFDEAGRASSEKQALPLPEGVDVGNDIAALVRRDGSIVVAFATWQALDPGAAQVRYDLHTRHLDTAGKAAGDDRLVESLVVPTQGGIYHPQTLTRPRMAQWEDGAHVLAWQLGARIPHQSELPPHFLARHLDADGRPAGPTQDLGPSGEWPFQFGLHLATLDEGGGWLARTGRRVPGVPGYEFHGNFQIFGARFPLQLPEATTLPTASFVLDLPQAGAVLFSGERTGSDGTAAPYSQWFTSSGHAGAAPHPLPVMPTGAVALLDGSYVVFPAQPGTGLAQRYTPEGEALGEPVATGANLSSVLAEPLGQGGMALGWIDNTEDETRLLTRRFDLV